MTTVLATTSQRADRGTRNYADKPLLVYWEMTQACALACHHCRAEAMPFRHPLELNNEESKELLKQITAFGDPLPQLVLTGGDPLSRLDLFDLIDYARALGLGVSITPSATQNLTRQTITQLKAHGIQSMALSLDGSTAARHDAIRGVMGCFERTIQAARDAAEFGLPLQINTLVAAEAANDLPAIYELLKSWQVMRWSLFFLIRVGRARVLKEVSSERGEELMHWVYDISRGAPFPIKTTEAPSYRRVTLERMRREGLTSAEIQRTALYHGLGIRDGHGIVFISHTGEIYPAGFLPRAAGNVRRERLVATYRTAPIFERLHNPNRFKGRCGRCEYRFICGGSRARAFAATGDPLESDPLCSYQPA